MQQPATLDTIAQAPPDVGVDAVAAHLSAAYGLVGELTPLVSERDQNFQLRTRNGECLVVKIAGLAESTTVTEFQARALQHLEKRRCPVAVPRVIPARDGSALTSIELNDAVYSIRVVTWLNGQPMSGEAPSKLLAYDVGRSLAAIDAALSGFEHAGQHQSLLWDLQRADDLLALMHHIDNTQLRDAVTACIDDFSQHVSPTITQLRNQVIHNDLNPDNVLVSEEDPMLVVGVIDFGDMVRAPLIFDVAIAAAYLRRFDEQLLEPIAALVAGFHSVTALEGHEVELLYDLLRTRLATSVTLQHWRISARREDDPYLQKILSESTAERFLEKIDAIPRGEFTARVSAALLD